MKPLPFYSPKYYRALDHARINGFFARDLDADDHAFLEQIRERGNVGCGSLAQASITTPADVFNCGRPVLDEELDYWVAPFSEAPTKYVPPPALRPLLRHEDPIKRAELLAQRKRDQEMQAAELERERQKWQARQAALEQVAELRRLRWSREERDWEMPEKPRHYLPHWKRDEITDKRIRRKLPAWRKLARAERRAKDAAKKAAFERAAREAESAAEREAEQRAMMQTVFVFKTEVDETESMPDLKCRVFSILKIFRNRVWTAAKLASAMRPRPDVNLVEQCLQELVAEGHVQTDGKGKRAA